MEREQVLALLAERLRDPEIVERVARRYPDMDPALELVPLAIGMQALEGDAPQRIETSVRGLTEQCRNVLRLRLQGRSFEEMTEELETDSVRAYTRCRKRLFPATTPLAEYALGTMPPEERLALFAEALRDPRVFQSLRDEHTLLTLSQDPATRARLLEAAEDVQFTVARGFREWFDRPKAKILTGLGLIALLAIAIQECGKGGLR